MTEQESPTDPFWTDTQLSTWVQLHIEAGFVSPEQRKASVWEYQDKLHILISYLSEELTHEPWPPLFELQIPLSSLPYQGQRQKRKTAKALATQILWLYAAMPLSQDIPKETAELRLFAAAQ